MKKQRKSHSIRTFIDLIEKGANDANYEQKIKPTPNFPKNEQKTMKKLLER